MSALATACSLGLVGGAAGGGDTSPPVVNVKLTGQMGADGWYVSDVSIQWAVRDPQSGIARRAGCARGKLSAETTGKTLTCTARNNAGLRSVGTVTIRIDKSAPVVTATPDRGPDANGWYNHAVTVTYTATDAVSGVVSCDGPTIYQGPDGAGLTASGNCADRAGHTGSSGYAFQYDATPTGPVEQLDAAGADHRVTLTWHRPASDDGLSAYIVTRTGPRSSDVLVYEGKNAAFIDRNVANDVKLRYGVQAVDQAGNRSPAKTAVMTPVAQLLVSPQAGAEVRTPPVLRWAPFRSPRYYNVQLWRGGGKIMSAWPSKARLRLTKIWTFNGRRYRLSPGRYRWFVFPGYGPRVQGRYGKMLGSSVFFVR
jgi:hypothetical protein